MQPVLRYAGRLRSGLTLLCWAILAVLIAERLAYAGVYRGEASGSAIGIQALLALPALAQLAALWELRRMVASAAAGSPFAAAAALGLRRAGIFLLIAAALTLFAAPAVHRLTGTSYPRSIEFDTVTLITGAIGAALAFIARLVDHARAVQSELDEIF